MCGRCAAAASVAAIPEEEVEEEGLGDGDKVLLPLLLGWWW